MNFTDELSGLERQQARYAFYYRRRDQAPVLIANAGRFRSASMIKVPILLAWLELERAGLVSGAEDCDLDAEPQVQGAGFSWLMRARRQPYDDLLLMMIALSDNLATNLVIRRAGLERLQESQERRVDVSIRGPWMRRRQGSPRSLMARSCRPQSHDRSGLPCGRGQGYSGPRRNSRRHSG